MKNKKLKSSMSLEQAIQAVSAGLAQGSYAIGSSSGSTISAAYFEDRRAVRSSAMLAVGPLGLFVKGEKTHPITVVVSAAGNGSVISVASPHNAPFGDIAKALKDGEREAAKAAKAAQKAASPAKESFTARLNAAVAQEEAKRAAAAVPADVALTPPATPAGWHPDPTERHEMRYWDGTDWTGHVSNAGVPAVDSIG